MERKRPAPVATIGYNLRIPEDVHEAIIEMCYEESVSKQKFIMNCIREKLGMPADEKAKGA